MRRFRFSCYFVPYTDSLWSFLYCNFFNFIEYIDSLYWIKRKKVITCRVCGYKIYPYFDGFGPKSAGWQQLKNGGFICHCCLEHSENVISKEWQEFVNKSNESITKKIDENRKEKR